VTDTDTDYTTVVSRPGEADGWLQADAHESTQTDHVTETDVISTTSTEIDTIYTTDIIYETAYVVYSYEPVPVTTIIGALPQATGVFPQSSSPSSSSGSSSTGGDDNSSGPGSGPSGSDSSSSNDGSSSDVSPRCHIRDTEII
jgi:hypothetical protein